MNLTDRGTVRALCDKYGFSFNKKLGQHFLVNPAVCPKICEVAGIDKTTNVLEIGPGFGTLTRELANRAKKVVALELDSRLLPVLEETLQGHNNVAVVQGDVMKENLKVLLAKQFSGPVKVCANLPYNLTSPIIMRLLEEKLKLESITVMVQREAADRLCAVPGTRLGGAITYAVNYYAQPHIDFTVSPGSFYPPPKVVSSVITLALNDPLPLGKEPKREERLFKLVRASFTQRRKTLANSASAGLGMTKEQVLEAMKAAGIPKNARPEELSLKEYIRLEKVIWPSSF